MRLFVPRTISGLAIAIGCLLAAVSLGICLSIYSVAHGAIEAQLDRRIQTEAEILTAIHDHDGIEAVAVEIARREARSRVTGMGYILAGADGTRLAGTLRAEVPPAGWTEFLYDEEDDGDSGVSQALSRPLKDGTWLVVAADRTAVDEMDKALFGLFAAVFAAMLIIWVGGAMALGSLIRQRLARIDRTALAIIEGDLSRRVPRDGTGSEFDHLSETLNRMLDRNAELVSNLRQVSNDIAHDLRTPLTRLQQVLDDAAARATDVEAFRLAFTTASDRSRELLALFDALLRISEIESLKLRAWFTRVDLGQIADRVLEAFGPDLEAGGYVVETAIEPECFIEGDRHLLSQLLANLVENVMRHTPPATRLRVSVQRHGGEVVLTVSDTGAGIAPQDREDVLRRFARLEKSRSTPGFGLGLSLVAAIARVHYAEPVLGDNAPGLRMTFRFPAA